MKLQTFVLVVQAFTGDLAPAEIREPGMTLEFCQEMAWALEARDRQIRVRCYRDDAPANEPPEPTAKAPPVHCPGYRCPPMHEQPVVCGFAGGCWQGGWRLKGAMPGIFQDNP